MTSSTLPLRFLAVVFAILACPFLIAAPGSYAGAGQTVLEMVLARKVDAAQAKQQLETMRAAAVDLCKQYAKAHPAGAKLIETVLAQEAAMSALSAEDLEHQWHDLDALAGVDVGIDLSDEDNEHFTDPIHALVHVLLVGKQVEAAASGSAEAIDAMKEDLSEGLEQFARAQGKLGA